MKTANVKTSVAYLTLSIEGNPSDARREAIEDIVCRDGGRATWRSSVAAERSYALIELPAKYDSAAIRAAAIGTVYETAVIAVAVFPAVPEALPSLLDALGGPGRPAGVLACRTCPGGVIIEWDPDISGVDLVRGLVSVELHRYGSGWTTELLAPLPPSLVATIAAQGLAAPEIAPKRVLEFLIGRD
jgi:hypothetical protein